MKRIFLFLFLLSICSAQAQKTVSEGDFATLVNVFLGTSGDHGQLSPAASYPFSMMSIGPQTYPHTHTGYEHNAKKFLGFTHNRFEGVGCTGSGGNILIKPFLVNKEQDVLWKKREKAAPCYYEVQFTNGISAEMTVVEKSGMHQYTFPDHNMGFELNLDHTLSNRFVAGEHSIDGNSISGWIESTTTCNAGKYRVYYALSFSEAVTWNKVSAHRYTVLPETNSKTINVKVAFSSVDVEHAKQALPRQTFSQLRSAAFNAWNNMLGAIKVEGDVERKKLFYSLLYRTIQSPYIISEKDGSFRGNDGSLQHSADTLYNGWAIWDNYRTQLPLISLAWPQQFRGMANSIANLYRFGKKDYATQHEPSNTVRTEHAVVVLLDALRKGVSLPFNTIVDSMVKEVSNLDYSRPDKALESCYDAWALSKILDTLGRKEEALLFRNKALAYKTHWEKDFKDITKPDADRMQARGLYQGTIWQYRWFVPFDVKGLMELTGGETTFIRQLDTFFERDLYNHANEPDIQVPFLYNATTQPWKSQALVHAYAIDTVVQYYFNDNSRGIDPFVDRIYKNEPKAYIRTMDDDAGAMSAWFIFAATGISPACVGEPVYYLHAPLFPSVSFTGSGKKPFNIKVKNFSSTNKYIASVVLNGKRLKRNYLLHEEILRGGELEITVSGEPVKEAFGEVWVSGME